MTKTISLEVERAKRRALNPAERKKPGEPWKIADLCGLRPPGHRTAKRGPRGGVILAKGQVWVELHSGLLMVLERFEIRRSSGTYRHQIWLRPYKPVGDYYLEKKGEASLRGCFKVWEDYVEFMGGLIKKVNRSSATDPESPFRHMKDPAAAARRFFGIDEKGNRID